MIPARWLCAVLVCVFGCEPAAKAPRVSPEAAAPGAPADAEALAAGAECEGDEGWCGALGWGSAERAELRSGATWLGVRATVRGARVDFSESAWVLSVRGERVGVRELDVLDARVRKGLTRQALEVARGARRDVVMESPAVAAAIDAPAPTPLVPAREERGWRLGSSELRAVGGGRWMSRDLARDGSVEWTMWVEAELKRPDEAPAVKGDEVPLEKLIVRHGCGEAGEEGEGVEARACEVLRRYGEADGALADGAYAGWFVRPAGGESGRWSARVSQGEASLTQEGLEPAQVAQVSGSRFEVTAAFKGREEELVTVWSKADEGGGWVIARSKVSGVVWYGRLEPAAR